MYSAWSLVAPGRACDQDIIPENSVESLCTSKNGALGLLRG